MRRACYAADRTGHMILQTLYQNCVKLGINFFNEYYVLDLAMIDVEVDGKTARPSGVVAYELATGELHVFQAKAIIFATGGFGKIYKTTSNAHTLTGDGVGIIWRKGLPLEDMEFFQFHPTGLAGLGILLTEGARGEGAILRNASGERFMERYAPTIKDLAPRDIVARCMVQEVAEGRGAGPHKDYVLLDCTHLGAEVLETKLPDITEFARTYLGVDPVVEPVPVMPTAHYAMGGIPTNVKAEVLADNDTVVPGLYAAGECACVSVHGSNRLGTNSLLDINVFGKRAGNNAVEYVKTAEFVPLPEDPADGVRELHRAAARHPPAPSASRTSARSCRTRWTSNAQVFRTDESLDAGARRSSHELRDRYRNIARRRTRASGSTPTCSRRRAGLPARPRRGRRLLGAQPQGEPRRPHARRLPEARRRELHEAHDGLPDGRPALVRRRRPHQARLEARRHHALPADGEEVLR